MNTQLKKGILEMCVLFLIQEQDMYGFEVIETISKDIDVNENTIYPILRRLTKQGMFNTYEKQSPFGAPRKYYKITKSGGKYLHVSLDEWRQFLKGVSNILGGNENE